MKEAARLCSQRSPCCIITGGLLIDHNSWKPYPMFMVGDFSPVDKVFLGTPGDSLLFNGKDLIRLKRKGYQVSTFKEEPPKTSGKSSGTSLPRAPPDSTSSKKSSFHHGKHSPRVKEQDKCDKESHSTFSKHKDKSHSDRSSKHSSNKEGNKSPCKHCMSLPPQPASTERALKECCMDDPTLTSSANIHTHPQSPSKCMSMTEDQPSFITTSSTSTPNKIGSGLHYCSNSTDSSCSMTPLDTWATTASLLQPV